MRVGREDEKRIIVTIKESKVATEGKRKGKTVYETFESFDVFGATPEAVYKVAYEAIRKA